MGTKTSRADARAAGRKSVLVMVERRGEQRFVGLPVEPKG